MHLNQIWHCPRPALAKSYLALLAAGPVVSTTIFAPRRTGKTVFLRQDLTPAAQKAGYVVAYADLWQIRVNPGMALVRGLEEALAPKTLPQKPMQRLHSPVRKLKASGSVGALKGEVEIELDDPKKHSSELALRIDDLIARLVARKPLLLLVDEAQELARSKDNELVATALRTSITKHRDRMRVVFTGSSRTQLAHVFSNADAPLYSVGAAIQNFPLLGRELVDFVAGKFQQATRRSLNVDQAWTAFQSFKQQPEPFLAAVVAVLMEPALSLEQACGLEKAEQDKAENHESTWAGLDALQKQLTLLFANDPFAKPFSKAVLARLAKALGLPALDAATVQFALRKLGEKNIVSKSARNLFVFESAPFERWVKTWGLGRTRAERPRAPADRNLQRQVADTAIAISNRSKVSLNKRHY